MRGPFVALVGLALLLVLSACGPSGDSETDAKAETEKPVVPITLTTNDKTPYPDQVAAVQANQPVTLSVEQMLFWGTAMAATLDTCGNPLEGEDKLGAAIIGLSAFTLLSTRGQMMMDPRKGLDVGLADQATIFAARLLTTAITCGAQSAEFISRVYRTITETVAKSRYMRSCFSKDTTKAMCLCRIVVLGQGDPELLDKHETFEVDDYAVRRVACGRLIMKEICGDNRWN